MLRITIHSLLVIIGLTLNAQENSTLIEDISFYADVVANVSEPAHKVRANELLVESFEKLINKHDQLGEIKGISQITPPDSSFVIYSWQVQLSEEEYKYHGYIVKDNEVITLSDQSESMYDDFSYLIGDKDLWFGQLYYKILPFETMGEEVYLLFGFNAFNKYENIKVAEVLSFQEDGSPLFGKPLFLTDPSIIRDAKQRIILQYSDDSRVNLNYNPGLGSIVFDHLIQREGQLVGQGATMISDGSYEGYSLNEGYWIYNEKLFDHVYEKAPRPDPVLDNQKNKKDIFGKTKN